MKSSFPNRDKCHFKKLIFNVNAKFRDYILGNSSSPIFFTYISTYDELFSKAWTWDGHNEPTLFNGVYDVLEKSSSNKGQQHMVVGWISGNKSAGCLIPQDACVKLIKNKVSYSLGRSRSISRAITMGTRELNVLLD